MRAGFAASSLPGSRVHSSCEWCAQCIYPIYTLYDVHIHAVKQDAAIWKMPATRATGCSGLADARGSRRRGGVCESPLRCSPFELVRCAPRNYTRNGCARRFADPSPTALPVLAIIGMRCKYVGTGFVRPQTLLSASGFASAPRGCNPP